MKTTLSPLACVLLLSGSFCNLAHAVGPCYTVYGKKDVIVYRSEEPPIDLSHSIRSGIDKRFPGGHLVMQSGVVDCPSVLPSGTRPNSFGMSPDDSPALRLPTPFSGAHASADGAAPAAPRKRAGKPRRAVQAVTAVSGALTPTAVATPDAVAADGSAAPSGALRMTSYRRSDGRVVASYMRTRSRR